MGWRSRSGDLLLARLGELGVVTAGGRQRTDSTHVLAGVRSVNRLEFLTETLRAALEALAAAAPDWLACRIDAEWVGRYGARADSYRLPQGKDTRTRFAVQVGRDGSRPARSGPRRSHAGVAAGGSGGRGGAHGVA